MDKKEIFDIMTKESTHQIVLTGLMAGIMCILGPWQIPLPGLIPISLGSMGVYFAVYILGMKQGFLSVLIYLLLGFAGVPVFTGFSGGAGKVLGPTGGYLAGYLFLALIFGFFVDRWVSRIVVCLFGMILGTAVLYLFGSAWLAWQNGLSLTAALAAGAIPFLPGDLLKMIIVLLIGSQVRKRIKKAAL